LRNALLTAQAAGDGLPIRFALGDVPIDLAVVARRDGAGKAGVHFGVVAIGAQGGASRDETHQATGRAPEISSKVDTIPSR
jgi:hypothetical protein